MKLYELLENNAETNIGETEITSVTDNTAEVREGSLFICVKGQKFDGHSAAAEMLEKGAAAVVCDASFPVLSLRASISVSSTLNVGRRYSSTLTDVN